MEVGTWAEEDDCSEAEYQDEQTNLLGGANVAEPESEIVPSPLGSPQVPWSPAGSSTPYSPGILSPTRRRSGRARFGSIIPDYTNGHSHIAPTGFSIGLGAASPGFVLRPTHGTGSSHAHGHRARTLSEGQAGILDMIRGASSSPGLDRGRASIDSPAGLVSPGSDVPGEASRRHNRSRTASQGEEGRRSLGWWSSLMGAGQGEGRIRLGNEADGGGGGD